MSAGNDWSAPANIVASAARGVVEALSALGVQESEVTMTELHHEQNARVGGMVVRVSDDAENMAGTAYTVIVVPAS